MLLSVLHFVLRTETGRSPSSNAREVKLHAIKHAATRQYFQSISTVEMAQLRVLLSVLGSAGVHRKRGLFGEDETMGMDGNRKEQTQAAWNTHVWGGLQRQDVMMISTDWLGSNTTVAVNTTLDGVEERAWVHGVFMIYTSREYRSSHYDTTSAVTLV